MQVVRMLAPQLPVHPIRLADLGSLKGGRHGFRRCSSTMPRWKGPGQAVPVRPSCRRVPQYTGRGRPGIGRL